MMIGSLGPCLPMDLLEATGRYAGPLEWDLARETAKADQWLESKFPAWARSIVEDWADGRFDGLDCVVFSRGDDVVQRLYYYLCELQRRGLVHGPQPVVFDVAKIPRPTSVAHTTAAVRRLAAAFDVAEPALEASIAATNVRRAGVGAGGEAPPSGRSCLLVGTPPAHRLLHEAIAAVGFAPVGPTLDETWAALGPPVEERSGDPAAAIGRHVHVRSNDRRGFAGQVDEVLARVSVAGPSAAVLWYTEEDEARIWDIPAVSEALANARLPVLTLTRRDDLATDGAPNEIRDFLQGIGR